MDRKFFEAVREGLLQMEANKMVKKESDMLDSLEEEFTEEQIAEAMSKEFGAAFAKQPKGVEVHTKDSAGKVSKQKFFGTDNAVKSAAKHIADAKKKGHTLVARKLIESEEGLDEMQKADVPTVFRKQQGEKPLTMADVKAPRKDSMSSKEALAKANEEAKSHTVPKTDREKDLAAMAEPKDKITHADVMVGRGVGKKKMEEMSSKEKMKRGLYNKEEVEFEVEQFIEIVEKFDDFEVIVKESYTFGDYLVAAKSNVGNDDAVGAANEAFKYQDEDFIIEAFTRSDVEDKMSAHTKAGNKVSDSSFKTKNGEPYAEYTVTDKEGQKRKYIHHGKTRKVETLG